jgi:hypothetical protein
MANYLKYSDIPIFANFTTQGTAPSSSTALNVFAATEASLSLDSNLQANRYLGKAQIRNDFSVTGPLEGKFSLTFFPLIESAGDTAASILNIQKANQLAFFALTGDFSAGHQIIVSNFLLKQCYLQNYSVKINAYQPVSISANFISYDITAIINTTLTNTTLNQFISKSATNPYYEGLHALTTKMGGSVTNIPETKVSIDINVDCNRTPIYTLGQKTPDNVVLNTVERTTTIQGENIGKVMDITGANPGATEVYFMPLSSLGFSTPSSINNVLKFDINGRITSQQLSTSQNSIVNGRVVIKEIIL